MAAASPLGEVRPDTIPLPSVDVTCLNRTIRRAAAGDRSELDTLIAKLRSLDWEADKAESLRTMDWVVDLRAVEGMFHKLVGKSLLGVLLPALNVPSCSQRVIEVFILYADSKLIAEIEPQLEEACEKLLQFCDPAAPDLSKAQPALKLLWKFACCHAMRARVGRIAVARSDQLRAIVESAAIPNSAKQYVGRLLWALSEIPGSGSDFLALNSAVLMPLLRSDDTDTAFAAVSALSCRLREHKPARAELVHSPELLAIVVELTHRVMGCAVAACKCLWDTAQSVETHESLLEAGVAESVTEALYSCHASLVTSAAGCCGNLCGSLQGAEALLASGGIQGLLSCISDPVAAEPARFAAKSLEKACRHDAIRIRVLESGMLTKMLADREAGRAGAGALARILAGQPLE
jgi:hypothetical protein